MNLNLYVKENSGIDLICEMLNSIDCAKMIIDNIQAPGNITIEEMVIRRIAGDF